MSKTTSSSSQVCAARHRAVQADLGRTMKVIEGMALLRPEIAENLQQANTMIVHVKMFLQHEMNKKK